MAVGDTLVRIARRFASPDLCCRILEPAIADLQDEYAHAGEAAQRRRALLGGYAAFWRSLASCLARDAVSHESRGFLAAAALAFVATVFTFAAGELLLFHTSSALRETTLRALYGERFLPLVYVSWSARINTATLMFGVPLAMLPSLMFARRLGATLALGAALAAIAAGMLVTIAASGWVAPAVVRWDAIRQHDRFLADTGGRRQIPAVDFDGCPDCRSWPDLIRGASAPLRHRYPGYPNYVAPEDRGVPEWYRSVVRERLLLIVLAMSAGLLGWWLGSASERRQANHNRV